MHLGLESRKRIAILAAFAVVLVGGGYAAVQNASGWTVPRGNLFSLIGNLNTTTSQVLNNTSALHKQVNGVANQLAELNTQSNILQQQLQTSDDLASQLNTQVQLTNHGVSLMQQILQRQIQTESLTRTLASNSTQLQGTVQQSAETLGELQGAMQGSLNQSLQLHNQMGSLLNEMSVSEDEFKFFGHVKKLLSLPSNVLQQLLGALFGKAPVSGSGAKSSGATLSGAPSQLLGSNPVTGAAGNLLGSVTNLLPH
jgi:hypothetical protein